MRRNGCQGRSEDEARTVELFPTDAKGEGGIRKVRRNNSFLRRMPKAKEKKDYCCLKKYRERKKFAGGKGE